MIHTYPKISYKTCSFIRKNAIFAIESRFFQIQVNTDVYAVQAATVQRLSHLKNFKDKDQAFFELISAHDKKTFFHYTKFHLITIL